MRLPIKFLINVVALLSVTASLPVRAQDALSELDFAFAETGKTTDPAGSSGWRGFLGAGLIALDRPVADRKAFLLPLVSVSYADTFYWNVGQIGAWLLKSDDRSARFGIALKARGGYDPDDYDGLMGMNKRDTSAELGLTGKWRTRPMTVSFGYYTDVTDKTNGNSAQLGFSFPIRLSDSWTLVPSVGADWLSAEVVNYYYGVRPAEAAPGRPAYSGESSVNLRGAVLVHYRLARAWSLFGSVSVTHLGSGVSDSPIIIHDDVAAIFIGAGWHF